jgi:ABC-type Mn2+/Zn2+ transport system permease subunit
VITSFLASWGLFQNTYLAGCAIAVLLSLVGVWVVARDQIFLGIAVSQASALGIATALWLGGSALAAGLGGLHTDGLAAALAVCAAVATALVTAGEPGEGEESAEAITGWIFLLAASLPVLMLAHSPHGLEELHRLAFSTLLGASRADLVVLSVLAVVTLASALALHRPLLLLALDPEAAAAAGLPSRALRAAVAVWLGACVGLSMRVSGMLFTFGCLVLPPLIAKNLALEMRTVVWLSPALALAAAVPGFVLAHHFDTPPAHMTVALLCAGLAGGWALARARRRREAP